MSQPFFTLSLGGIGPRRARDPPGAHWHGTVPGALAVATQSPRAALAPEVAICQQAPPVREVAVARRLSSRRPRGRVQPVALAGTRVHAQALSTGLWLGAAALSRPLGWSGAGASTSKGHRKKRCGTFSVSQLQLAPASFF